MNDRPPPNRSANARAPEVDFDLLPELVGYHLRRAQVSVFNDFVKTVAAVKITPGQFGVIALICANPGLTQSALARAVGIERSTMVAVIDALERRGLVERRPSSSDRRSYALMLTAEGGRMFEQLKPMVREHEDRITRELSPPEKVLLIDLMKKIAASD